MAGFYAMLLSVMAYGSADDIRNNVLDGPEYYYWVSAAVASSLFLILAACFVRWREQPPVLTWLSLAAEAVILVWLASQLKYFGSETVNGSAVLVVLSVPAAVRRARLE